MFHRPFFNYRNSLFTIISVFFIAIVLLPTEISAADSPTLQTLTSLEQAARTYFLQKDYAGACDLYRQAVRDYPTAIRPQCGLIKALLYLQDFTTAQAETEKLLSDYSADPGLVRAVRDVADYYLIAKRRAEAAQYYQTVIDRSSKASDRVWSLRGLARIRIEQDDFEAAEAAVGTLLSDYSDDPGTVAALRQIAGHYRSAKRYAEAVQLYLTVINSSPEKGDVLCRKGLACSYIQLEDFPAAQTAVNTLLSDYSDDPGLARAVRDVADSYLRAERHAEAAQYYQTVIDMESKPSDTVWSLRGLARIRIEQGDYGAAEAAVDTLLSNYSKDPNNPGTAAAIRQIADHYQSAKRYTEAKQLYQVGLSNGSEEIYRMWCQRGLARSQIRQNDFVAAESTVARLLSDYSNHPEIAKAVREVADCYLKSDDPNQASALYQQVLTMNPSRREENNAHGGIARCSIMEGDDAVVQAKIDLIAGNYTEPGDAAMAIYVIGEEYYFRGEKYRKEKNFSQEVSYYQKALDIWENNIHQVVDPVFQCEAYYYSAVAYQRMGDLEKAREYYQQVVTGWPDHKKAWYAQYMIAKDTEKLAAQGKATTGEVKAAYQVLLEQYPDSSAAAIANKKVNSL